MNNKVLFLSLSLLSFSAHPYTYDVDPNVWCNDSMDDDLDPNAKSAMTELGGAVKRQIWSSSTSSPTASTQKPDIETRTGKPRILTPEESRKRKEERDTRTRKRQTNQREQGAKDERIKTLKHSLEATNAKFKKTEENLAKQQSSKQLNRYLEAAGGAIIVGVVAAYNGIEEGVSALGSVVAVGIGGVIMVWNEASAQSKSRRINELKEDINFLNNTKEETEAELENIQ